MKKVGILMGSDSDLAVVRPAMDTLSSYGIPWEAHIMSAHRTPELVHSFAGSARVHDFGVLICAAGKAAHLAGVVASQTTLPVIGIPIKSSTLDGMDALLATVQMPSGMPVATVAIDGSQNAALLAIQMLAITEPDLAEKLAQARTDMKAAIAKKDEALQASLEG